MENAQPYSKIFTEIYDLGLWYSHYDYTKNAMRIMELLGYATDKTMLELGSGTGAYLHEFSTYYQRVVGLELSPDMRDISLRRYPHLPVHIGNMVDFTLLETFDAITLLYGSIGLLAQPTETESLDVLRSMVGCCHKHCKRDGVVVIEAYDQPHTASEWVHSKQYTLEDKYISYHATKTIESTRFAILKEYFLVTPKIPSGKTVYEENTLRNYLCTIEELIALFAEQGFRIRTHIPSFALQGRDLVIFEKTSN